MPEVGSAFVTIAPSLKGFQSKLNSGIGGDLDSSGKKAGSRFGGAFAGGLGKIGAAVGAVAVGGFLKSSISDASDLAESQSKVGVVFGKSSAQIAKASQNSATAMGLTKSAYLGATGTLGNLLVSLDVAPKKAADMSQQMVKLAGDLASFNNTSPEEALDALRSGLTGETEPLKRFGVNMNDATLKAQALKDGLITSTKDALTPQTKALAAQALIMEQTKTAQGDFARTSGGLANQQRILAAQFGNLKTTIGTTLLPVVTKFVTFLNGLGPVFGRIGTYIAPAVAQVRGFFSSLGGGGAASGLLTTFQSIAASIAANFLPVLRAAATTFQTVVLPAILRVGSYLVANLIPILAQVANIIATRVVPIFASYTDYVRQLYPAVARIVVQVGTKLKPVFDQLVTTLRGTVLPMLSRLLAKFHEYQPTIQRVLLVVLRVIGVLLNLSATILGRVLPPLIRFAGFLIRNVVGALVAIVGGMIRAIGFVIRLGRTFVEGANQIDRFVRTVGTKIGQAIGFIGQIPGKAASALGNLGGVLYNAGAELIQGLINGITAKLGALASKMSEVAGKIKGFLPGSPVKEGPLTAWNNGGAGKRLIDQGLIAGIDSRRKATASAMARLTAGATLPTGAPQFALAAAGGGAASSGAGPRVLKVYDVDGVLMGAMQIAADQRVRGARNDTKMRRSAGGQ